MTACNRSRHEASNKVRGYAGREFPRKVLSVRCENPHCTDRQSLRRFWRRSKDDGVLLQGHWYCSMDCFEQAIAGIFETLLKTTDEPLPHSYRIPIGLLLLGRGLITDEQLKIALRAQREEGSGRLGRWLVRQGMVSNLDVSAALATQWGCAVFPLETDTRYQNCSQMVPLALMEASRMIPVHYIETSQILFVGFAEDIDRTALYAVERLRGGRTEPCVVTESAMDECLARVRTVSRPAEIVFEASRNAPEMASTIRDYALKLGADKLALARPRRFLWVRLYASGNAWDLLFRLSPSARAGRLSP